MKKITITQIDENNVMVRIGSTEIGMTTQELKKLHSGLKKCIPKPKKYNNKKIFEFGREFDSLMELDFYKFLLESHDANDIEIQPRFVLQEKQAGMREIGYNADFKCGGVVYDVKGKLTQQGVIRIKLFKAKYPNLLLVLITKCPLRYQAKYGRWITVDDLKKERKLAKKVSKN